MKGNQNPWLAALAAGLILTLPGQAGAHGFRLPDQDARATARGEAFAATADNPAAIYYNPAGITQLDGHNARLGAYSVSFGTDYTSPPGFASDTKDEIHVLPQLFYTYTPETLPLSFGLGLYTPYGMGVEWPQDTGFRSVALSSDMMYLTVNPVVAWRVNEQLSLAAGPTINYSTITLRQGVTPIPNFDQFQFDGDGMAYGLNAGVMWRPIEQLQFGAAYRLQTKVDYEGNSETSFAVPPPGYPSYLKLDASAEVPFPQNIVLGVSWRPTPKWNLEFDVDWTDWDTVDTVNLEQLQQVALILNWESSIYYEFGVTRQLGENWFVSAGYIYNENSVPDEHYNPLVPDQDRQFVSVGLGYQGERFGFDVAYQYGFSASRTVSGSAYSAMGQNADGVYDYNSHAVGVSFGWKF